MNSPERSTFSSLLKSTIPTITILCSYQPVVVQAQEGSWFLRGNANSDSAVDVADGIEVLRQLFQDDPDASCLAAADANGDGTVDISDSIYVFLFLFLEGQTPPAPYPECGEDPLGQDGLECTSHAGCRAETPREGFSVNWADDQPSEIGVTITPVVEDVKAIGVTRDAYQAVTLLAPGEPIHALKEISDGAFLTQHFEGKTGAQPIDPSVHDDYVPTVTVTAVAGSDGCATVDDALLEAINKEFWSAAEAIDHPAVSSWISEVVPSLVCGSGSHDVLVVETRSDGSTVFRSGRIQVCEEVAEDCPRGTEASVHLRVPECGKKVTCRWIYPDNVMPVDSKVTEREREWNLIGTVTATRNMYSAISPQAGHDGYHTKKGPGPWHELFARRNRANCYATQTKIASVADGDYSADLNVVCIDESLKKCLLPGCESKLYTQAAYESDVTAKSGSGLFCFLAGSNRVETLAQDEARLKINDKYVFNKAVAVQNGNAIITKISFGLGANVGASSQQGVSASADVNFGFSETVRHGTGVDRDALAVVATTVKKPPASFSLQSKGRGQLNAFNRTAGHVQVASRFWYVVFAGESSCPGADQIVGGALYTANPSLLKQKKRKAGDYLRSVTGRSILWREWK